MKIGIGITTTSNRSEIAERNIETIRALSAGCKIVVVKDVIGIAKAKNECLRQLDDCEHIFLFDDDTYPKKDDWYLPYIEALTPHLSFTFSKLHNGATNGNRVLDGKFMGLNIFQNPCGCMMYIHKRCLDVIGGFDERFIGWGYEHVNFSQRVFNAGLTPYPFMDVANSLELLHSMDYYGEVKSSVNGMDRMKYIQNNRPIYEMESLSKEFIKYK
jgi:hypothetical protein